PALLGRRRAARRGAADLLREPRGSGAGSPRRPGRPRPAALPAGVDAVPPRRPVHDLPRPDVVPPPVLPAGRRRPVQGPADARGGGARGQPTRSDPEAARRGGDARERLAVLVALPFDRPVREAAPAEHGAGSWAARGGRAAGAPVHDRDARDARAP